MDPEYAHLCLVLDRRPGPLACIALGQRASPRDRVAERYSLLRKLTIVEGESETLCMNFCASDKVFYVSTLQDLSVPVNPRNLDGSEKMSSNFGDLYCL